MHVLMQFLEPLSVKVRCNRYTFQT